MKYIPDLIPKDKKVLPDYFKKKASTTKVEEPTLIQLLSYGFSAVLIIVALFNASRFGLLLLFLILAFLSLPYGRKLIESWLKFKLKLPIALAFYGLVLLSSLPMFAAYRKQEAHAAHLAHVKAVNEAREKEVEMAKELARMDSLNKYLAQVEKSDPIHARKLLPLAEKWLGTDQERTAYTQLEKQVILHNAKSLFKRGNYAAAEKDYSLLIDKGHDEDEIYYERANCYYRQGHIKSAVADLNRAQGNGYRPASLLYNKLNPIRRKVSYYVTRCCDGTTSSASGRGACSWHGGVCNWNDPVYEEYRKY